MKGFAFPRKNAGEAEDLAASLEANNRELVAWLNSATIRYDSDGSTVTLPGDLAVAGDITEGGTGLSLSTHTHTQPAFRGVYAWGNDSKALTNSDFTWMEYDNELYDTDAFHDNSTNPGRLTVPAGLAGYYNIGFMHGWDGSTTGVRAAWLYVNAAQSSAVVVPADSSIATQLTGTLTVELAVGDYVRLYTYHTGTGTVTATNGVNLSALWMYRVGI